MDFRSTKGHLLANFNKEGDLVRTFQRFKNVILPRAVTRNILKSHKGWRILSTVYVASGKEDIEKQLYKVKIKNGKKGKTLRIRPVDVTLASN